MYAYARASLLHYARWMAEHEYPYLDKPEILEYPTETWAAQDMRKSEIFKYAARIAETRADASGSWSVRASSTRLRHRPWRRCRHGRWPGPWCFCSRTACAGVFRGQPRVPEPARAEKPYDFGSPEKFVPQKIVAIRRFKLIAVLAAATAVIGTIGVIIVMAAGRM